MSGGLQNFGGGGAEKFKSDVPVSLSGGKTLGKYPTGTVIHAKGKTPAAVLRELAAESIYPTYQPAGVGIDQSVPALGEVGEHVTNHVSGTYYRNDGGSVTGMVLRRDGQLLATSTTAGTVSATDSVVRSLAGVSYQASADYLAGPVKAVAPDNVPDPRVALVRNPNAPQAAETGCLSYRLTLLGCYRYFWGPVASVPTSSAQVRALASAYLSAQLPGPALLATGTSYSTFVVAVPQGVTLASVIDLTALNAVLTSEYRPQPLLVEDAAGVLTPYTLFVMRAAVPYSTSHQHQLAFSA